MAIQTQQLLSRLQPLSAIDVSGLGGGASSMQRKQLALMRQRFEEEKRQNLESEKLRRLAEAGAMRREEMQLERQREQAQALAAAKLLEAKRAAHADLLKYEDAADFEGMHNAANQLNELGGLAEMTGQDANGLPTWHVELDAEKYRAEQAAREQQLAPGPTVEGGDEESLTSSLNRLGALGYDQLGARDPLKAEGPGIGSSSDMTAEQLARVTGGGAEMRAATDEDFGASQDPLTAESSPPSMGAEVGPPLPASPDDDPSVIKPEFRGAAAALDPLAGLRPGTLPPAAPTATDFMGGVPKNVVDTGAMAASTRQRLGPVMASIEASMPEAYQDSTRQNNEAALALGLPAGKAMEQSIALRSPADAATARELAADRAIEEENRKILTKKVLSPKDEQDLVDSGANRAWKTYTNLKVKDSVGVMEGADQVEKMLSDKDPANDDKAINLMMDLAKQVGAQSDADALRMTGGKIAAFDKVRNWLHENIEGGYSAQIRASMKEFAKDMRARQRSTVFSWLEKTNDSADRAEHPLVAKGYNEVAESLPDWVLAEYNQEIEGDTGEEAEEEKGAEPGTPAVPAGIPVHASSAPSADDSEFDAELRRQAAEAGLNYEALKHVSTSPIESGGNPAAVNAKSGATGIIQFMPDIAKGLGTSTEELKKMSATEQIKFMIKYYKDRGLTAEHTADDYYVATAAGGVKKGETVAHFVGKPDETVVYKKGSPGWRDNPLWRTSDDGDVTVGSIKAYGRGGSAKPGKPSDIALTDVKPGASDAKYLKWLE